MAANYTREIVFKVNDRAIKQATDRLVRSLDRIEKKLDVIATGFLKVEKSVSKVDKNTKQVSGQLNKWEKGIVRFTKPLVKAVKDVGTFRHNFELTEKAIAAIARSGGLAHLRTLLGESVKAQDALLISNSGYVQSLQATRQIQGEINQELIARQRILDGLNRSEGLTAGAGLTGLRSLKSEQKGILDRLLATTEQSKYIEQAKRVKDVEKLITEELKARDKIMNSLLTKQERLAKIGARVKNVAGKGAQFMRPGRGIERRGMGLAGLGLAGVGVHSGQMAAGITPSLMTPLASGVGGLAKAMGLGAIKGASFLGVLNAIGAAAMAQPQLIGLYATALMIWGNKVNEIAIGPVKLLHKGLWGLGKTLAETHRPVDKLKASLKSFSRESVEPLRMEFKLSADAAKRFELAVDGVAKARARLRQTRIEAGHMKGSGFGAWSARMDQQKKTSKDFAAPTRRKELKWANALEAANNRTVEIKGKQLNIEQRINRVMERRQRMAQSSNKQGMFRGGAGGAVSSAMIGGGFPLLFGQGGASAVGGGLGGLVGGALGGGFGFGLSIVGTAIGQWITQIDEFNSQVNAVNADMKALGFSAEFTGTEIKEMAKYLKISKEETMQLFSNYMRFGKEVGMTLQKFYGQDFSNLFAIGKIKDSQSAIQAIVSMNKILTFEEQAQLIAQVGTVKSEVMQVKLMDLMIQKQYDKRKNLIKEISLQSQIWYWTKRIAAFAFADDLATQKQLAGESPKERRLRLLKELDEEMKGINAATKKAIEQILSVENIIGGTTDKLSRINNLYQQIGQTINDGIVNAIEGAIQGTKTLGEVASSVFRSIARMMLQYGVQSFMTSMFPGSKLFGKLASGGPAQAGKTYLVGEKGPELFTPTSSGHVTPNHELGGSNIVVNVDASGSAVEGDDQNAQQLGEMLAAAIQSELIKQQRPGGLLR